MGERGVSSSVALQTFDTPGEARTVCVSLPRITFSLPARFFSYQQLGSVQIRPASLLLQLTSFVAELCLLRMQS